MCPTRTLTPEPPGSPFRAAAAPHSSAVQPRREPVPGAAAEAGAREPASAGSRACRRCPGGNAAVTGFTAGNVIFAGTDGKLCPSAVKYLHTYRQQVTSYPRSRSSTPIGSGTPTSSSALAEPSPDIASQGA